MHGPDKPNGMPPLHPRPAPDFMEAHPSKPVCSTLPLEVSSPYVALQTASYAYCCRDAQVCMGVSAWLRSPEMQGSSCSRWQKRKGRSPLYVQALASAEQQEETSARHAWPLIEVAGGVGLAPCGLILHGFVGES